jgi:hypothetical protein
MAELGTRPRMQVTSHHVECESQKLEFYLKKSVFGKGPSQGQIPGLLNHGSQIPDLTIEP